MSGEWRLSYCQHCHVPTFIIDPTRPWICGNCGKRNEPKEPEPKEPSKP